MKNCVIASTPEHRIPSRFSGTTFNYHRFLCSYLCVVFRCIPGQNLHCSLPSLREHRDCRKWKGGDQIRFSSSCLCSGNLQARIKLFYADKKERTIIERAGLLNTTLLRNNRTKMVCASTKQLITLAAIASDRPTVT